MNGKGLQCPICKSWITYVRLKSNELVCRKCGVISKINEVTNHIEESEISDIPSKSH